VGYLSEHLSEHYGAIEKIITIEGHVIDMEVDPMSRIWLDGVYIIRARIEKCEGCSYFIEPYSRAGLEVPAVVCSCQFCLHSKKKTE
jgi:hypothetical protein